MPPSISLPRLRSHIEALSAFGRNPDGQGITRSCWSPAHEEARAWLIARMKDAGLTTWIDEAGNTFGRLGEGRPTVMTGSHIDTVPQGGPLDGALGVLAGLECLQTIHAAGIRTRRTRYTSVVARVTARVAPPTDRKALFLRALQTRGYPVSTYL